MKTVGQLFKETRQSKNLTLEGTAERLNISSSFAKSIEESDYNNLPAEVYIKGVIKSYANLLEINEQRALALFRREYRQQKIQSSTPPQPLKKFSFSLTPNIIIGAFISLAILIFLTFLFWQYRNYVGKPLLVVTSPAAQTTIYQDYIEITGKTDPEAKIYINGQESKVSAQGSFAVVIGLDPGINHLTITARSKVGKEVTVTRQVEVVNSQP
ncbi:helix-turn-helix domain-containing protein [Patescibacteria group bacterium]|nr:helix-turn-helix domain-containing protein [Patescibacteria group bacterium]MBU1868679.1 helix-turn-helix domain-containing protein [Patescibacteria group bacterium]